MSAALVVAALRRRDWAGALAALEAAGELGTHGLAWRAQALEGLGRLEEAERAAAEAVRSARRAEDAAGLAALRPLHARILGAIAARRQVETRREQDRVLADTPDDTLLAGAEDDAERAARLVRKGNALADLGRGAEARDVLERARALAGPSPRETVLALLGLARVDDADRWVREAAAFADREGDPNLVTAVAHAARAAGVRLGTWEAGGVGPEAKPR